MSEKKIDYIGLGASTEMYKRNKKRIDSISATHSSIMSRLSVIEREAANVQRITDKVVHSITGKAEQTTINYIK